MTVRVDDSLDGIDWDQAKADLTADDFDNGRSARALQASFAASQHVAIARDGDRVVGMARLLSEGVCNAYLLDVWTLSSYRRQGVGAAMVKQLMSRVPGQHVGLQTDEDESFYAGLGYNHQPMFMSAIVGQWLGNEANAATPQPSDDSPGAGADDRGKHHRPFGKNLDQDTPGANDQERSERRVADDTQGQLGPWRGGLAHQHPRAQACGRSS